MRDVTLRCSPDPSSGEPRRAMAPREAAQNLEEQNKGGSAMTTNDSGLTRRRVVQAGLSAIAAPAVLRVTPAGAQGRVIKIGHVSPRTGPLAGFGEADSFIVEQTRALLAKGIS